MLRRLGLLLVVLSLTGAPASANHGNYAVYLSEQADLVVVGEVINGNPVWEFQVRFVDNDLSFICQFGGTLEVGGDASCQEPHTMYIGGTWHYHPYLLTPVDIHDTFLIVDGTHFAVTVAIVGL